MFLIPWLLETDVLPLLNLQTTDSTSACWRAMAFKVCSLAIPDCQPLSEHLNSYCSWPNPSRNVPRESAPGALCSRHGIVSLPGAQRSIVTTYLCTSMALRANRVAKCCSALLVSSRTPLSCRWHASQTLHGRHRCMHNAGCTWFTFSSEKQCVVCPTRMATFLQSASVLCLLRGLLDCLCSAATTAALPFSRNLSMAAQIAV